MTLEQLITCYIRKSSKIVVTKITSSTKERIFSPNMKGTSATRLRRNLWSS